MPLPGFRGRLVGGVYGSVAKTRQSDHRRNDDAALRDWPPPGTFSALDAIHDHEPWQPHSGPAQTIARLTAQLLSRSSLLDAVVFAPDKVLDRLLATAGQGTASDTRAIDAWIAMCWTAEAAWRAVSGELPAAAVARAGLAARMRRQVTRKPPEAADPVLTPADLALLRPLAARLRFLVLSEPMRARGPAKQRHWWDWPPDRGIPGDGGIFARVLGERSSWTSLVDTCREARTTWQDYLDNHQDYRVLRFSEAPDLEREIRLVLFRESGWRSRPLSLSTTPLDGRAGLTYEDRQLAQDAVERHLLPRFALWDAFRLILDEDHAGRRRRRTALAVLVASTALAAVALTAWREVHLALYADCAAYALVCAGIVLLRGGSAWALLWLLRMPAASAVGIIALDSFMPGGWLDAPAAGAAGWFGAHGWRAVEVLTAASFGYLAIEARNHGVPRWLAPWRAFWVTVIGAVHALLISLIGLIVVAPAFVPNGYKFHGLWATINHHPGQEAMLLALATAWCLAFGVFSQILWDDRPITASLAHLNWRRGK